MSTRTKQGSDTLGPTSFFQLGMPFWQMLLETDTPSFVFQPMKMMALGQIQTLDLINKRCLACLELPQKLSACRSPEDFMRENQRFFQAAQRDYSDAMQAMARAWENAVAVQTDHEPKTETHHDYLPLANTDADDEVAVEEHTGEPGKLKRARPRKGARSNGASDQVSP